MANKFGGFGGFGGGNMQAMMRQAQKMQQDALKAKEELDNTIFEGSASGGMVKVEINGEVIHDGAITSTLRFNAYGDVVVTLYDL